MQLAQLRGNNCCSHQNNLYWKRTHWQGYLLNPQTSTGWFALTGAKEGNLRLCQKTSLNEWQEWRIHCWYSHLQRVKDEFSATPEKHPFNPVQWKVFFIYQHWEFCTLYSVCKTWGYWYIYTKTVSTQDGFKTIQRKCFGLFLFCFCFALDLKCFVNWDYFLLSSVKYIISSTCCIYKSLLLASVFLIFFILVESKL